MADENQDQGQGNQYDNGRLLQLIPGGPAYLMYKLVISFLNVGTEFCHSC